jgi:hypothetical protein
VCVQADGDVDDGAAFISELKEKYSIASLSAERRVELCPALWHYRKPFSLQDFILEYGFVLAVL